MVEIEPIDCASTSLHIVKPNFFSYEAVGHIRRRVERRMDNSTNINVASDNSRYEAVSNITYHLQNIHMMKTSYELDLQQSRCS